MKQIQPITLKRMQIILDLLRKHPTGIHLRGIERITGIHHQTVARIVENYLDFFVESQVIEEFGLNPRIIRLRQGKEATTLPDVLGYLEVKKRIRGES